MRAAFPGLIVCAALLSPGCAGDGDDEPGSELGPCVDGQFCVSPLQCVEQLCVHPDQLDDTGVAEDGSPTSAEGGSPTSADGGSPTSADDGPSSAGMSTGDGTTSNTGGTTGSDPTDASASASDVTGNDGGDACAPPECSSYATKMQSCYPMLDNDWYDECLYVADVCHIDGPCVLPAIIACSIAASCEAVTAGDCLDGDAC